MKQASPVRAVDSDSNPCTYSRSNRCADRKTYGARTTPMRKTDARNVVAAYSRVLDHSVSITRERGWHRGGAAGCDERHHEEKPEATSGGPTTCNPCLSYIFRESFAIRLTSYTDERCGLSENPSMFPAGLKTSSM